MEMPLDDFIKGLQDNPDLGSHKDEIGPWYNSVGDCIEFQTVQEAYVADRVDEFLTIYRSADTEKPIGFQIKDVKVLLEKFGFAGMTCKWERAQRY